MYRIRIHSNPTCFPLPSTFQPPLPLSCCGKGAGAAHNSGCVWWAHEETQDRDEGARGRHQGEGHYSDRRILKILYSTLVNYVHTKFVATLVLYSMALIVFNSWFIIFCQLSLDYVQGKVSLWYDKEKFISQCLLVHTKTGSYIKHTSWLFDSDFLYPFFVIPCSTGFQSIANMFDHAGRNWDWLAVAEAMDATVFAGSSDTSGWCNSVLGL